MPDHREIVFPAPLTEDLRRLSEQLEAGLVDPGLVSRVLETLGEQPLSGFAQASDALRYFLSPPHRATASSFPLFWKGWFSPALVPMRVTKLLNSAPGIEYLYLFHHSGWHREAALKRVTRPVESPFWLVALAYRLNDWVPQVREAAAEAFERAVQLTPAEIAAEALIHLIGRAGNWGRWTLGAEPLAALQRREDVAEAIVRAIVSKPTGPLTRVLRDLLRSDAVDAHLLAIARDAIQPGVRAAALEVLLHGEAKWPVGRRKRWIDKSMGEAKYETSYASRPVERPCSFEALLQIAAADRSAVVRKVAASGLIAHEELSADPAAWATRFSNDANGGVRERGEFLLKRPRR